MPASNCQLASHKPLKIGILILGFCLMCATSAWAETQYESVYVNGIELNGFQVFALERATGKVIPNGNYWYEMASDNWGYVGGPSEGLLNLPESFKKHTSSLKKKKPPNLPQK